MTRVREVVIARDAYLVCMQHVHTTDGEEVMGLLVGSYTPCAANKPGKEQVVCTVSHAVILRRSDKRKDRVEISPEMLIQAQQKAEDISAYNGTSVHIVGWYHSHPKITVAPSAVDLGTQFGYQQMDDRFVGIIFSVFNKSETSKVSEEVVGAFQAAERGRDSYERVNVPVYIGREGGVTPHNQEAVCSLSNILQQEQLAVLQLSRDLHAGISPLQHLHNAAVCVQRVSQLCEQVQGPLVTLLHARVRHTATAVTAVEAHIAYLEELVQCRGGMVELWDSEEEEEEKKVNEAAKKDGDEENGKEYSNVVKEGETETDLLNVKDTEVINDKANNVSDLVKKVSYMEEDGSEVEQGGANKLLANESEALDIVDSNAETENKTENSNQFEKDKPNRKKQDTEKNIVQQPSN